MTRILIAVFGLAAFGASAAEWPVLRTYEGGFLRRVKMPMGGIGTGTISLAGNGALVDWELGGHPDKGYIPTWNSWAPSFTVRCETADGEKRARLLEGPIPPEDFEGAFGCPVPNHGVPRFTKAVFKAAYPLAQVELEDPQMPLTVRLEAMNPLVKGDAGASGIPGVLFRWNLTNRTAKPLKVSVCGTLVKIGGVELALVPAAEGVTVTRASDIRTPGWNVSFDRFWRTFLNEGVVADTPKDDSTATRRVDVEQVCAALELGANESRPVTFALAWRNPRRMQWRRFDNNTPSVDVGNWYATRYPTAQAAAEHLLADRAALEEKTVAFVREVMSARAPDVVKEAALFNLSTLRSETCFRTADGHFFGWEGCGDREGSCWGSCTHVWGYEHALVDIWPDLAKDMCELQFGPALGENGHMVFRIDLPLANARKGWSVAAADGQMQCIVKAYECWKRTGDDAWIRKLWPDVRKALAFSWIEGGWDADVDGVMEGCQHNTMDVEYYGPNPQMEFLYLAALKAAAEMAAFCGEAEFAAKCRGLAERGSAWTEKNLFNGAYYEHLIRPPKGKVADGVRHPDMGARDLSDPDFQLGSGCLIDQLLGDYSARSAGLGFVADRAHARTTLATILKRNCHSPTDDGFNPMRDFVLQGESSLRMGWYDESRLPRSPFPYYRETMTGFEYVVAALLAWDGQAAAAEKVVRDIRDRYDGRKRNPFDEAECGHHYARALAAWTVLKAFSGE